MAHSWKETGKVKPHKSYPGHAKTFAKKLFLSEIDRNEYWPKGRGRHEVTFAVNLKTLEVVWYTGKREGADKWKEPYQDSKEWVSGTIDWVVEKDGKLVLLGDLKTGRWPVEVEGNKQLYTYALPFWIAAGRPLKWKIKLRIEQWPRYPLNGLPQLSYSSVTGIELRLHLEELREALSNPVARPDYETCMFCDGKSNCEAFLMSDIDYSKKEKPQYG